MKLNIKKWNEERIELETSIKEYKVRQRERYQPRWTHGPDDWDLSSFKHQVTDLYTMRAAVRGKNHIKEQTKEQTEKVMEMFQKTYAIQDVNEKAA